MTELEPAARLICEADPHSPEPDAVILVGTKRAKAWEPRAEILRQAIDAGLFAWPPKAWIAPAFPASEMYAGFRSVNCKNGEGGMAEFTTFNGDFGNWATCYLAMRDAYLRQPPPPNDNPQPE